jgi:hypothetical protein
MKTLLIPAAVVASFGAQQPDAGAIRDRLDQYLRAYEPQLSTVVADEEMTQRTRGAGVDHRRIHSEVAFISLPGGAGWIGFRRVLRVNDQTVKDRGVPLAQLMSDGSSQRLEEARRLLADSAAHNLGAPRTINLPNLPLELLHPRHRHRFKQEVFAGEKVGGVPTVVLQLDEIASPTIIQQAGDSDRLGDMKTVVWAWVEPVTGRLLRARVTTRDIRIGAKPFVAEVRVDFRHDGRVGMLVPAEMAETFFVHPSGSGTGTAKYTNYRQFKTGGRIVPQ